MIYGQAGYSWRRKKLRKEVVQLVAMGPHPFIFATIK
jgi:hypothetical protein